MRRFICLMASLFLMLLLSGTVFAAEEKGILQSQLEKSGIYSLLQDLPDESHELFPEDFGSDSLSDLSLEELLSYLKAQLFQSEKLPFRLFFTLLGAILFSALIRAIDGGKGMASFVSAAAVSALLIPKAVELLGNAAETADSLHRFILRFVPVFTGVCAVSGKAVSALAYEASVLSFVELYSVLASEVILPLTGISLAVTVCGSFSESISTEGIAKIIKSFLNWMFVGALTLFSILLSAKTVITSSADAAAVKTMKFLAGSLIPVVGSSLNDAYSTVYGCLSVVKSTVGLFGIIAVLLGFLPPLAETLLAVFFLKCAAAVGELLGEKQAVKLLEGTAQALSIALGVIFSYEVMVIISVTMMLLTGGG